MFFPGTFFSLCVIRLYVIHFIHSVSEKKRICLFHQKADFTFATEKCKDSGKGAARAYLSAKRTCKPPTGCCNFALRKNGEVPIKTPLSNGERGQGVRLGVRLTGIEPARRKTLDPKSSASANSATGAFLLCRHLDSDQGPPPCQGDTLTN